MKNLNKNRGDYWEILYFYYIEKLKVKEIANLFCQSEPNIRVKIHRATKMLKDLAYAKPKTK